MASTRKTVKRKSTPRAASTRIITAAWHKPKCNACHEPIVDMHDALAACFVDKKNQSHTPVLVHIGRCYKRLRQDQDMLHCIHVETYRRSPLEAIIIAMRRRATSEAERIVWHSWISVVLGLPAGDESCMLPGGGPASTLLDHVMTIDEARRLTEEES